MRRYSRTLVLIAIMVGIAVASLAVQRIDINFLGGQFTRGGDTVLGLRLGLDLQGGSHLVYQASKDITVSFDLVVGIEEIRTALEDAGIANPEVERQEEDSFVIKVPSLETGDQESIRRALEENIGSLKSFEATPDPTSDQMEGVISIIERRVNAFGVAEPSIQLLGSNRVLVQLPDIDVDQAKQVIGETATLEFKERTVNVVQDIGITSEDVELAAPDESSTEGQVVLNLQLNHEAADRFEEFAIRLTESNQASIEAGQLPDVLEITVQGSELRTFPLVGEMIEIAEDGSFSLQLPGLSNLNEAKSLFGESPELRFQERLVNLDTSLGLTGQDLARAFAGQNQTTGEPIVNIQFNGRGARIFADVTARIAGTSNQIAIFLDSEELLSPVAQQAIIGGNAIISGSDFTFDRVRTIAIQLESGRLPIPIEVIQERSVDATLGKDSLRKSLIAGLVGLGLVLLFMVIYYRIVGLVAAGALMIYAVLILAIFKLVPVTLTLSGIAAFILSIGMAVDANILIFERMKEELRAGRTLGSAITEGFSRAWTSIRDSNVSTMITCAILFWFGNQLGASIVQGFALTLFIGVVVSMFTAVIVTRTFLRVLATTVLGRRINLLVPVEGRSAERPRRMVTEEISP